MSHAVNDAVSLALTRRIAEAIRAEPLLVDVAQENLSRWSSQHGESGLSPCLLEWQAILERPVEDVLAVMTANTEKGQRLRQSSPFAWVLPYREVWEIKKRVWAEHGRETELAWEEVDRLGEWAISQSFP